MRSDLPPSFQAYEQEEVDQLAVGSAGKNGVLEVTFTQGSDGRTNISREFAKPPFHIMRDLHHDEQLTDLSVLYIQNPSGGVAQGDRHRIDIDVQKNAKAHVTTQSATKIHRMNKNYARSHIDITVQKGGYLEFLPDPTILYQDARYQQTVEIDLQEEATILISEVLVPGRLARGEQFEYERYHSRTQARYLGTPVLTDIRDLSPEELDPRQLGILDKYPIFGDLYVISNTFDSQTLSDNVYKRINNHTEITAGSSVLPDEMGIVVRALGHTAEDVMAAIHAAWDETRSNIFGVTMPKIRKY